jgi:ABC-2 type transport system ATP-binding protein
MTAVVKAESLTKRFGEIAAVTDLSFVLEAGTITGFLGPNGAGKTTTLRMVLGLAAPTSGRALVFDKPYAELARPALRVGAVLEATDFHPGRSGRDHLRILGRAVDVPDSRADEVLRLVELDGAARRRVKGYSLGMRQRLGLAVALLGDPDLLILDEPANGLDPQARIEMRQVLLDLADRGKTLLVTSHVLPELARVCHRVAIITRGRLRAFGTLAEITRQLSQSRPMEVLLTRADQIDAVMDVVRTHLEPGAEVTASQAEAVVRFRTAKSEEDLAGLLAALVGAGLGIAQYREVQTDLEEAFMTVARNDESAVAAGQTRDE